MPTFWPETSRGRSPAPPCPPDGACVAYSPSCIYGCPIEAAHRHFRHLPAGGAGPPRSGRRQYRRYLPGRVQNTASIPARDAGESWREAGWKRLSLASPPRPVTQAPHRAEGAVWSAPRWSQNWRDCAIPASVTAAAVCRIDDRHRQKSTEPSRDVRRPPPALHSASAPIAPGIAASCGDSATVSWASYSRCRVRNRPPSVTATT